MGSSYSIKIGKECLKARIKNKERKNEITYVSLNGDRNYSIIEKGHEVCVMGKYADWEDAENGILNYFEAYERLGSKLREQLPEKWHRILGEWLKAKENKEERLYLEINGSSDSYDKCSV